MGRGVEHDQVGLRARRQVADVGRGAARGRRPRWPPRPPPTWSCACRGRPARCRTACSRCRTSPGCSRSPGRPSRPRRAGGGHPGRAGGCRIPRPAAGWRRCRPRTGDRRRGRERVHVGVGQERAVIGRRRAELDRQQDALARAELAGVDPGDQPARPAGRQHRAGLVDAERAALAEHVHPPRVRRAGVEHRAAHQVHVALRRRPRTRPGPRARRGTSPRRWPRPPAPPTAPRPRPSARSRTCTRRWWCPARASPPPACAARPAGRRRWRPGSPPPWT